MAEQRDGPETAARDTQYLVRAGGNRVLPVPDRQTGPNPLRAGNRLSRASWRLVARRVGADFFLNAVMDRGAVLTFFTVLTFAPTVLAAYSIATLALARNQAQVTALTTELIDDYVPADLADDVRGAVGMIVGAGADGTVALVVSVLFALLASSAYVRAFARAANAGYGRVEGRNVVRTWATMWAMTLVLVTGGVLLIGALLLRESIVERFVEPVAEPLGLTGAVDFLVGIFLPVWRWLRFPVVLFLAIVLLAVLYRFAPNVKPTKFRWLTLGSASALLASGAVWASFSWYLANFAGYSAYGAIGTVLALLAALWVNNVMLVVGVKIDAEVLRAKELQVGMDSERDIQAPPRSSAAAQQYANIEQGLEAAGRSIKDAAGDRRRGEDGDGPVSGAHRRRPNLAGAARGTDDGGDVARHPAGDLDPRRSLMSPRPPFPPFNAATAAQKARGAEDAWNSRDPEKVSLAYTPDSAWRNRDRFVTGREEIVDFLRDKWATELEYRLIKEVWAFEGNRIAARFVYEWHDDSGQWFRSHGNENWEFDDQGLMSHRHASINDVEIEEADRLFRWPLGPRPEDHPGLSELGL